MVLEPLHQLGGCLCEGSEGNDLGDARVAGATAGARLVMSARPTGAAVPSPKAARSEIDRAAFGLCVLVGGE